MAPELQRRVTEPPLPSDQKLDAIAYINSNCGAKSGRAEVSGGAPQPRSCGVGSGRGEGCQQSCHAMPGQAKPSTPGQGQQGSGLPTL